MNKKDIILNCINSIYYMIISTAFSITSSFIFDNSLNIFIFFNSIFLLSMGIPSLLKLKLDYKNFVIKSYFITLMIIIINIVLLNYPNLSFTFFIFNIIATFILGLLSGFEIPFFLKENKSYYILFGDLLGTSFALIIFSLFLYPFFGIINSLIFLSILYSICFFIYYKITD